jgi:septum formation protein
MKLVLASQSPRRRELLDQLGVHFDCCPADIDETPGPAERAEDYVVRLAIEKARAVAPQYPDSWVLGSDTSVVINGQILGKPESKDDATRMLLSLSDATHQVLTAIALVQGDNCLHRLITTDVRFREITPAMAEAYWQTGEPCDKAGSYGIQGLGGMLVRSIEGSYSAVVGLPLAETADLLMDVGIEGWWSWQQA